MVVGAAPNEPGVASTIDVIVTQDASSAVVTTVKKHSTTNIIEVGGRIYTKMDAAAAIAGIGSVDSPSGAVVADPGFPGALTDRWVYTPVYTSSTSSNGSLSVTESTTGPLGERSLHILAESLRHPGISDSPLLDAVGSADREQHACYVLSRRDGSELFIDRQTLLPVRFTTLATNMDGASNVSLDRYNAALSIKAPAGAVSMESLLH